MLIKIGNYKNNKKCLFIYLFIAVTMLFSACFVFSPSVAFAESDGPGGDSGDGGEREIHIYNYHYYYIPFVPGMDNCFGAYRVLASRGYQAISTLSVRRTTTPGKLPGAENVTIGTITDHTSMHSDARTLYRDDMIVFADFHPSATVTYQDDLDYTQYPYIIHNERTYYFEIPFAFAGMMADMTPNAGSQAIDAIGRPWTIAVDEAVAKKYMDSFSIIQLSPNYKPSVLSQYGIKYEDDDDRRSPMFRKTKVVAFKDYEKSDPAGKDKDVYAFIMKKYSDPKNTEFITDTPFRRTSGRGIGRSYTNNYYYILSLNPYNESNVDMAGWWSLYSVEILNSVDNMRTEKKDMQMEYDKDTSAETAIMPPGLKDADSWEKISITFSKDAFKDYIYDTVLSTLKPYGVWKLTDIPGYKRTYDVWKKTADKVENEMRAASKAKKSYTIPLNSQYPLSSLQSTSPGYWVPPKASMLENKLVSVFSNDPKYMGFAPYSRAVASLYFSRDLTSPTFNGAKDPYEAIGLFLGTGKINESSDFRNAFYTKVRSSSFQAAGWNDPWLPYMTANSDIWNLWYRNDNAFYKSVVPLMALDTGMALWDVPGATAWNLGIQRNRGAKVIAEINTPINTTVGFSASVQNEFKSRNYGEEAYYQDRAGETRINNVPYIGQYNKQRLTDFGSVKLAGNDSQKYMTPLSVRYFPMDIGKMQALKSKFAFIGQSIKIPSYSGHSEIWKMFPRPSTAQSGYNTSPPVW